MVWVRRRYDTVNLQKVEQLIGQRLKEYVVDEKMVLVLLERVAEAHRIAQQQMKEEEKKGKKERGKEGGEDEEDVVSSFKRSRKVSHKHRK